MALPMSTRSSDNKMTAAQPAQFWLFAWAIFGVLLLLGQATYRLSTIACEALSSGEMTTLQYWICGVWSVANCYLEGYRGFHLRFVPRVVARAVYLSHHPKTTHPLLAPIFAMAFYAANRKGKAAAWGVTGAVLIAIVLVRQLAQPWRGIIDAGVVVGLLAGSASLAYQALAAAGGWGQLGDPALPQGAAAARGAQSAA